MPYYRLESDLNYRSLCWDGEGTPSADQLEFEFVRQFWTGQPIQQWWQPPLRFRTLQEKIELEDGDVAAASEQFAKGVSDCPFYSAALLIVSSRACDGLHDLFIDSGQFLPIAVACQDRVFYAFNCTKTLDCLDTKASIIEYDEDEVPPRPRMIRKYVFDPQLIGDCNVFRMNWPPPFDIYISHDVVDRIERLKLRGFVSIKLTD